MYHSLAGLPKIVVLDSNCLLDSCLVVNGLARRAVLNLRDLGFIPAVPEDILTETRKVLNRMAKEIQWTYDPAPLIDLWIKDLGFLVTPRPDLILIPGVNIADQSIAQAASDLSGWVLTGDAPLFVECQDAGIPARFSFDVVMHKETNCGEKDPPLDLLIRCHPFYDLSGFIFSRIHPQEWDSMSGHLFSVIDIPNLIWLRYDSDKGAWIVSFRENIHASVKAKIERGRSETLLVNFHIGGMLELRVASNPHPTKVRIPHSGPIRKPGKMLIGRYRDYKYFLNGIIYCIVAGHKVVSKRKWDALCKTQNGAPNPWDEDKARQCLSRVSVRYNSPSEPQYLLANEKLVRFSQ